MAAAVETNTNFFTARVARRHSRLRVPCSVTSFMAGESISSQDDSPPGG
jgi:hypothetical protein